MEKSNWEPDEFFLVEKPDHIFSSVRNADDLATIGDDKHGTHIIQTLHPHFTFVRVSLIY